MVNYQNAKIYAIKSNLGDKIYVGSTTKKYLSSRMTEHRSGWKEERACMSRGLFDEYGVENCYIELIELFPCKSKDELKMRENHYISSLVCVNKNRAIITPEERKEYVAEYYEKNREKIHRKKAEYRQENKEELSRKKAEHYEKNREEIIRKAVEHYEKNKEEILRKKAEYREKNKEIINRKQNERYVWKVISREFRAILNED